MDDGIGTGFGPELRRLRLSARLSQEELAARAGMSVRTVRNLELGRTRPRLDSVRLLAGALALAGPALDRFDRAAGLPPAEPSGQPGPSGPSGASGPSGPAGPSGPVHQLPRDLPDFGERDAEVAALVAVLAGQDGRTPAVRLAAVAGPAGVGKTALAVHVAHRLRDRFPDGQLYVRLRAGGTDPLPPGEVLGRFLRALGVEGGALPPGLDERAALFRSRVADRRLLVLLDDTAGEEQVRPLLPGGPGNAVLLTGRQPPAGLEGLRTVRLDVLDGTAAMRMLGRIAGPDRVAAEPADAGRIAAACGGLPLALRIAGARLGTRPAAPLGELADALGGERDRLDELATGDLAVRAGFAVGYRDLDEPARRAFRLLGLLPGPDLPAWTVDALLDGDPDASREVAGQLLRTGLLDLHGGSGRSARYGLHDLVRLYARERALATDPEPARRAALRRVLSGWQALADRADRMLPSDVLPLEDRVPHGWRPDPDTADALLERPLDWFERERPALAAAVRLAAEVAPDLVAGLADSLVDFCATRDYPEDWAALAGALLRAAQAAGDDRLAGHAERRFAELALYRSDEAAEEHARRAVAYALAAGTARDLAAARLALGGTLRITGRPADSLPPLAAASDGFAAAGDRNGQGHADNEYGMAAAMLGREDEARRRLSAAAGLLRAGGDIRGECRTLVSLGGLLRVADPAAAVGHFRRAAELADRLGDRTLRVTAAVLTGRAQVQLGDTGAAIGVLTAALAEAREQHRPDTVAVASLGLGEAGLRTGDPVAAREHFTAARSGFQAAGMAAFQGLAEAGLGDVARAEGGTGRAREHWAVALRLLETAAPSQAELVRARLADTPTP